MLAVTVHANVSPDDPLWNRWQRLWDSTPAASFTQSPQFLAAHAAAIGAEPVVYLASVAGRVVGLWPLLRERRPGPLGTLRVLTSGSDHLPRLGPLGPHPTATAAIVARHLAATSSDWDALHLGETLPGGGAGRISAALAAAGLPVQVRAAAPLAHIRLDGRWTDLLARCDDTTRFALYRAVYNTGRDDGHTFVRVRGGQMQIGIAGLVEELQADLRQLSTLGRTWGSRAGWQPGLAAAPPVSTNLPIGTRLPTAQTDLAVLRYHGQPIGGAAGFVTATGIENLLLSIAHEAPPGTSDRLMAELLRDALARGDRSLSFTATAGHPAIGWASDATPRQTVRVLAPGRPIARLRHWTRRRGVERLKV